MQVPPRFAERLHLSRRRLKLGQWALGSKVGLTGYAIGRLERGETTQITIDALRRLARELEVSLDWLLAMDIPDEESGPEQTEELITASHV